MTFTVGLGLLIAYGIVGATLGLSVSSVVVSAGALYVYVVPQPGLLSKEESEA